GRSGDWLVASGDALSPSGIAGFFRLGATGIRSAEPFHQSAPGMTVSEGAVALRLSSHQGADGPALLGTGISSDAGHPTHPDPSGVWLEQAISDALRAARTDPADVAGVIAHGTGTTANDSIEAGVIGRIFGEAIPVTSIKGALGHIMGAAGLLNLAVACEAWATGVLPPTLGNGPTWPGANVAPAERNLRRRRPLLALASGFGGNNVAALIG
ncbi:MAG: 3-oxoacyl-ACP synthase, partial [Actinomycetota bacterium]